MPRWTLSGSLVLLLVVLAAQPVRSQALPDWTSKIRTDHPRLFFNADTWPAVKQRALGDEKAWYQRVRSGLDRRFEDARAAAEFPPQDLGPQAAAAAFVFLVSEDDRYLELARKCLRASVAFYEGCYERRETVNWYGTSRVHAVLAWDWLYDHLPAAERSEIMSRLILVIDRVLKARPRIYRENISGYETGFYGVQNCLWFIGCTALGSEIEVPTVERWLVWGHDENRKLLAHRQRACGDDGGGASPTLGYVLGAYPWAEQNFFYTWLSATGENIAPDWPHGAWLANYVIWNWIAAEPAPLQFGYGDTPHTDNRLPVDQLYTHMANIRHLYGQAEPEAAALARHVQGLVPRPVYSNSWFIYPFLLADLDASPASTAPRELGHARNFDTMGQLVMRSGTGPEDTYCLFTCGGILRQHRHYDALNFVLYHRGFLALDSGTRYDEFANGQHLANYFAQTVAHNCVVVHQQGEPPAPYWGGTVEGNHGGQHKQLGSVLKAFETDGDFVYAAGDATECYRRGGSGGGRDRLPEKCSLVTRQIVFLLPQHFVIFDRVTTTDAGYRKDWLLHTAHEPEIQGSIIRAEHGEGRMWCRTLLPKSARLTAVGGPDKEFLAAGTNWALQPHRLSPDKIAMMGQWRVEVTPQQPSENDVFLHVIQVGDRQLAEMSSATLIEQPDRCGVRLQTGDETWEVSFDTAGELGGHIRRTGPAGEIDRPLTSGVQPQSGIVGP